MVSPRTSRYKRSRRKARSMYDEAMEERTARESLSSMESSKTKSSKKTEAPKDVESEDESVQEEVVEMEEASESGSESESEDEEEMTMARKTPKRQQKTTKKPKSAKKRNIQLVLEPEGTSKKLRTLSTTDKTTAPTRRAAESALSSLAKKVLDSSENPSSSLVAALLHSYKQEGTKDKKSRRKGNETYYTAQLEKIARQVVEEHDNNPNKVQVDLFNLLFRSCGGSVASNLDHEEIDLENVSDEEWADLITFVLEEMEQTPADCTLLCADPLGAAHASAAGGKGNAKSGNSVGIREYRKIYEEFWFILGAVVLSETQSSRGDDDNEDGGVMASSRFALELARELLARLVEMVGVGQPDIRGAATAAIFRLAEAMLERTVELNDKLTHAERHLAAAKKSKMSRKSDALKSQVDVWKRTVRELEEIVTETVMGVFLKRYRDSNEHIRADSLSMLSRFTLIRPDIFLVSQYLKYFGWMLSDKEVCVRESAITALLVPFREAERQHNSKIDTSTMGSVIEKFLPRLADCAMDVDHLVQERAMELLLTLAREGMMDTLQDDALWQQINLQALTEDTTPSVRQSALLFIIEQLEPFDAGPVKSETTIIEQLNAIVQWTAEALSDSDIPVEHIKYKHADYIVASLRASPDHCALVSNWSAMLRALSCDHSTRDRAIDGDQNRLETVKQRVLLRMIVCAADLEVRAASSGGFMSEVIDSDLVAAKDSGYSEPKSKKRKATNTTHQELTVALLEALPRLLTSFKSETLVLQNVTSLPRYFLPSVFNLPSRKKSFAALVSAMSEIFQQSTDVTVLKNCSVALVALAEGDHARSGDALVCLKNLATALKSRLMELFDEKARLSSEDTIDKDDSTENIVDTEHSISICFLRLRVMSKLCSLHDLLGEDDAFDFFIVISESIAKDLNARRASPSEASGADDDDDEEPKIWKSGDQRVHGFVGQSVVEATSLLLSMTSMRLVKELDLIDEGIEPTSTSDDESHTHVVVRMRDCLVRLAELCFDQYLDTENAEYTPERVLFSTAVQNSACELSGDMRSLFPKQWARAKSPFLRACALVHDSNLIGGCVRLIRSQQDKLNPEEKESHSAGQAQTLLVPLARGLVANWKTGNRREAGMALTHITGSGQDASDIVSSMSKVLKKIEPVRLLEAQMACLRQDFEDWLDSVPDEPENDRPTELEMTAFEIAEKKHVEKFELIEQKAARLSSSLGVGKLSNKTLAPSMVGFVLEGIRFSFSTDAPDGELPLGTRLTFLRILSKYLTWIRREEEYLENVRSDLNGREYELRHHPDFADVFEEDMDALLIFRKVGALGDYDDAIESFDDDDDEKSRYSMASAATSTRSRRRLSRLSMGSVRSSRMSTGTRMSTGSALTSRMSTGSVRSSRMSTGSVRSSRLSTGSVRSSRLSTASSVLSPLYEDEERTEGAEMDRSAMTDSSPLPTKRRKVAPPSAMSALTASTIGQSTIAEASSESSEASAED